MSDSGPIPLALYVHLPWCVRKCPYCDFNSHAVPAAGLPEQPYLAALLDDLEGAAAAVTGREIVSVFFGGGTPSLFSARAIGSVLARARTLLPVAPDVEVTLEANPGTVEHGRFADYAAAGVNRISLGAQSFADASLQALGRIHASGDIERAVGEVRRAGIANFNLDLMYALPGQDLACALADLERALELGPTHLSHYQLTLEPATPFAKHPPPGLPDDDVAWSMQEACQSRLAAAGFEQYEVSGYARPGQRCRHNLVYWEFGDYLGIGAGAHGKVTVQDAGVAITRTVRVRHPAAYLAARDRSSRLAETRRVAAAELPFEFVLNALRLNAGFALADFERRTGLTASVLDEPVAQAVQRGLLQGDGARWYPTALGRRFLNDLQALFLPV
jgi:oxygen-independent coproporphyrinogen-3 oxidase